MIKAKETELYWKKEKYNGRVGEKNLIVYVSKQIAKPSPSLCFPSWLFSKVQMV